MADKKVEEGVLFPKDAEGKRSTTQPGKDVLAASVQFVDKGYSERLLAEKKWRFKYNKYIVEQVEIAAKDPRNALRIAKDGLEKVHSLFEFVRDGKTHSVKEAMNIPCGSFETATFRGSKPKPSRFELEIPYQGKILRGSELQAQVEKWVQKGTIELSAGFGINQVAQSPNWLDLSGKYFVLLGALSAMGPLRVLLALGANVIAVDINRPAIWEQLLKITEDSCGTLIFPVTKEIDAQKAPRSEVYAVAGCDLINKTPEIKNWLLNVVKEKPITVGAYAYLDSDLFVRLSVAMDAIIDQLCKKRKNVSIAYLCTPTDCHLIPPAAAAAQAAAFRRESLWEAGLRFASGGKFLTKNSRKPVETTDGGDPLHVVDAIVVDQGPNYILAKRIQHWRSVVAREEDRCIVSTNIAPSTATVSVVKNRSFAWAYNGMHNFRPMEVFKQETSNAVMTALLLYDINSTISPSHPDVPLRNPMQLFSHGSFHGGPWRTAHKFNTIGVPSALLYFLSLVVNFYLGLYNSVQTGGWLWSLFFLGISLKDGLDPWLVVGPAVSFFQGLALLEIVHAALGIVQAPVFHATVQIFSRILLVGIINTNAPSQTQLSVSLMLFAWCLTEVIRYGFFALKQAGVELYALKWLRYSLFIALYPLGVYGELATAWHALPFVHLTLGAAKLNRIDETTGLYVRVMRLVESYITADAADFIKYFILPAYSIGLPFLYLHMLSQRKKVLGSSKSSKVSSKGKKAKAE